MTEPKDLEKQNKKDAYIDKLFNFFLDHYVPANSGPGILKKTTNEIFEIFREHYPSVFLSPALVFEFLSDNDFKYETPGGDLEFVWLMKYKPAKE